MAPLKLVLPKQTSLFNGKTFDKKLFKFKWKKISDEKVIQETKLENRKVDCPWALGCNTSFVSNYRRAYLCQKCCSLDKFCFLWSRPVCRLLQRNFMKFIFCFFLTCLFLYFLKKGKLFLESQALQYKIKYFQTTWNLSQNLVYYCMLFSQIN